jgi:hypothetical protein
MVEGIICMVVLGVLYVLAMREVEADKSDWLKERMK